MGEEPLHVPNVAVDALEELTRPTSYTRLTTCLQSVDR